MTRLNPNEGNPRRRRKGVNMFSLSLQGLEWGSASNLRAKSEKKEGGKKKNGAGSSLAPLHMANTRGFGLISLAPATGDRWGEPFFVPGIGESAHLRL